MENSHALSGERARLGASLKCPPTNSHSWGNKLEERVCVSVCGAITPSGSWRCVGIAHTTGVLQWEDTGSLGRTGWEGKEEELPFMSNGSWEARSFAVGMARGASSELVGQDWQVNQHG